MIDIGITIFVISLYCLLLLFVLSNNEWSSIDKLEFFKICVMVLVGYMIIRGLITGEIWAS